MKGKFAAGLVVLALWVTPALAFQMTAVALQHDTMVWADIEQITGTPTRPKIWSVYLFRDPRNINEKLVDYFWGQDEMNCDDHTYRTVYVSYYTADGGSIGKDSFAGSFEPLVPGTAGEALYNFVCSPGSRTKEQPHDINPKDLLAKFRSGVFDGIVK